MVDLIDENNQSIGQVSKQQAHEQGLLHRIVLAEVINSKGEWLLVQQAPDRQEALFRETQEELGIKHFEYKRVGQKVFNRFVNNHQENHLFILYEIYSDLEPTLNHESISFRRFTFPDLIQELANQPKYFGDAFHFVMKTFY